MEIGARDRSGMWPTSAISIRNWRMHTHQGTGDAFKGVIEDEPITY